MINVMYKGWQKLFLVGIFILFLWSFFLRFYHFGNIPNGLYWDETAILLDAKSVAETGKDMHGRPWYQVIYPSYGDYKLPVYIWLSAVSVKVLGASEVAVRLPSALAGLLTIGISGLLIKELLENEELHFKHTWTIALVTALMVAVAPWSILFSRTGFEAHVAQSLLALSLYLAIYSKKVKWLIFLSPIIGVLATYTYFSVRYVWLGEFVLLSILFLCKFTYKRGELKRSSLSVVANLLVPLVIFTVGLFPMLQSPLYEASNTFRLSTDSVLQNTPEVIQSNVYREVAGNQKVDRVIFNSWWLTGKNLFSNYSDNVSLDFLFVSGDPNMRHGTSQFGLFFVIFLPFFFVGWYVLFRRYKKTALLLFAWWMFALLPASVPNTTPHALRSLNALVPLSSVIGIGVVFTFYKISEVVKKEIFRTVIACASLLLLSSILFQFTHFYFVEYPQFSSSFWQGGYRELAQTAFTMRSGDESIYVVQFDDRFYLWLLLYGPYSARQIQNFPHQNFQIRDFDNVYTEHFPDRPDEKVELVGSSEAVESYAMSHNYQVTSVTKILRSNEPPYEVANLEMNKINEK